MSIHTMLEAINKKAKVPIMLGKEESIQGFTKRTLHKYCLYNIPEDQVVEIAKFESTDLKLLEADVIEFLFDLIITEKYDVQKEDLG